MGTIHVECEQSLFSTKIRGKERKTSKRASVTVSVTWEQRCHGPLVAAHGIAAPTSRSHAYLFCSFPRIFEDFLTYFRFFSSFNVAGNSFHHSGNNYT